MGDPSNDSSVEDGMTSARWLFGFAIFLGSFLLFLVEPIAAKQLLPMLGGSAAVWITCLVFFQTALLVAYLYAHWLARRPRWFVHFGLLVFSAGAVVAWAARSYEVGTGSTHPIATVFFALSAWIGLPFLALGATSPLLQVWWTKIESGGIPYKLFALSNSASLLALALYPGVIEPELSLRAQRIVWAGGFALFAVLSATLAAKTRAVNNAPIDQAEDEQPEAQPAPLSHKLLWV